MFCVGNRNKQKICRFESGDRDFLPGNSAGDLFEMVQISDLLQGLLVSFNDLGGIKLGHELNHLVDVFPNRKALIEKISHPKDHWTLKTGYFEDPTPAIQVQTLPLEGPRSLRHREKSSNLFPWEVLHIA